MEMNSNRNVFEKIQDLKNERKYEEVYGETILKQVLQEGKVNKGALKAIVIALLYRDKVECDIDFQQYRIENEKSYKEMGDKITGTSKTDLVYKYYFYECGSIIGEPGCKEAQEAVLEKMGGSLKAYLPPKKDIKQGEKRGTYGKDTSEAGRLKSGGKEKNSLNIRKIEKNGLEIQGRTSQISLKQLLFIHDMFLNGSEGQEDGSVYIELSWTDFEDKVKRNKDLWKDKKGLAAEVVEKFPQVVQCSADKAVVRFFPEAYESARKNMLFEFLRDVLAALKNKGSYSHMLNAEYLNYAREKGDEEVWWLLFAAIWLRDEKDLKDNVLRGEEEEIKLPEPEELVLEENVSFKTGASFAELATWLGTRGHEKRMSLLHVFYMYQCGLIAGTEEDRKACFTGIKELMGLIDKKLEDTEEPLTPEKKKEYEEYLKYMKSTLDFHFLRLCTEGDVKTYIEENKTTVLDDALRALLCAFAKKSERFGKLAEENGWGDLWKTECFQNESYVKELRYGKLAETFECMMQQEPADVVDRHGRLMQRLVVLFPDSNMQRIRYEELLRDTVQSLEKERIVENCIADFESVEAWDHFTKFYHETGNNYMRDAGNMYELLRFHYVQTVRQSVLTNVQRSIERTVMGALSRNFLDNNFFFLKLSEVLSLREQDSKKEDFNEKEALNQYWSEFVNQVQRHHYLAGLKEDEKKKEKVLRFFDYACAKIKRTVKFPSDYVGGIVYMVLEENRELWGEFWLSRFRYKFDPEYTCPFERFLLQENKAGKYKHSHELYRVLAQTFIAVSNEKDAGKKEELNGYFQEFFRKCDVEAFSTGMYVRGEKAGKQYEYGHVVKALADFINEREARRDIKDELMIAILKEYPKTVSEVSQTVYDMYGYTYSKEYFTAMEYVQKFYGEAFFVQEDIFMNLKLCLGDLFGNEANDRGDSGRVRTLLFKSGQCLVARRPAAWKQPTVKMDILRYAKDMYALTELFLSEEEKRELKEKIRKLVENTTGDTDSLEQYDEALKVLLSSSMSETFRQAVIDCGFTNHWDPFVDAVLKGDYDECEVDEKAFNLYLAQIDYRKFRRSTLQRIVRDMNAGEEVSGYGNSLTRIIGTDLHSVTGVLYSTVDTLEKMLTISRKPKAFFGLVLTKKYREWENLKSAIGQFYEDADDVKLGIITTLLGLLIVNSYYPNEIVKLIHSMSCDRETAQYARNLLNSFAIKSIIAEYRVNYYTTISCALTGDTEEAKKAYQRCEDAKKESVNSPELFADENMIDRCNKKLKEHVIDKSESGFTDDWDERIMRMELEPAGLFKFDFLHEVKPDATESFAMNKTLFEKQTTSVAEKCKCARHLYYWMEYGGDKPDAGAYGKFLLDWALYEVEYAAENDRINLLDTMYKQFLERLGGVDSVFVLGKEVYEDRIREMFHRLMATAKIQIPRNAQKKILNASDVRIGGKTLIELEGKVLEGLTHDFNAVFASILVRNKDNKVTLIKEDEDASDKKTLYNTMEQWKTNETASDYVKQFALNFLTELDRRKNGDLEFAVLNKDEDEDFLYLRIKNISGVKKTLIYMDVYVPSEDGIGADKLIGTYKLKALDIDRFCYGAIELGNASYDECAVVFYENPNDIEHTKICEFDKFTWKTNIGPSANNAMRKGPETRSKVEKVAEEIIKDSTDKWMSNHLLPMDTREMRTAIVGAINETKDAFAIDIQLDENGTVDEKTVMQKVKAELKDQVTGNSLTTMGLKNDKKLWVLLPAKNIDDFEKVYARENRDKVCFVFCGDEWRQPETEGWEAYLTELKVKVSLSEKLQNTRERKACFVLDETLECMEELGLEIADAINMIDAISESETFKNNPRNNVYPTDLKAVAGVELNMIEKVKDITSATEVTALALKSLSMDLSEDKLGEALNGVLEARGYGSARAKAELLGIPMIQNDINELSIIGKQTNVAIKEETTNNTLNLTNIQNNFVNVFNIYNSADLEELKKAEDDLAAKEAELAETEEKLAEAEKAKNDSDTALKEKEAELEKAKDAFENKKKEAEDLWAELTEKEKESDRESAEAKQKIEDLKEQKKKAEAEAEDLKEQKEKAEAEAGRLRKQKEDAEAKAKDLEEQKAKAEEEAENLRAVAQKKDTEISQKETEVKENLDAAAEEYKPNFNLDIGDMAVALNLFGKDDQNEEEREKNRAEINALMSYLKNNRVENANNNLDAEEKSLHEKALENAVFVHYLFAEILEKVRKSANGGMETSGTAENSGVFDYSPVALMYGKFYEALLKVYHVDVYGSAIGSGCTYSSGTSRSRSCAWSLNPNNQGPYFDTLTRDDKEGLTIGAFWKPIVFKEEIVNESLRITTKIPYFDALKAAHSNRSGYWDSHVEGICGARKYRNDGAHSGDGRTTVGAVTKDDVDKLVKNLFEKEGYKLIFLTAGVDQVS